jgi:hypothetical protein
MNKSKNKMVVGFDREGAPIFVDAKHYPNFPQKKPVRSS